MESKRCQRLDHPKGAARSSRVHHGIAGHRAGDVVHQHGPRRAFHVALILRSTRIVRGIERDARQLDELDRIAGRVRRQRDQEQRRQHELLRCTWSLRRIVDARSAHAPPACRTRAAVPAPRKNIAENVDIYSLRAPPRSESRGLADFSQSPLAPWCDVGTEPSPQDGRNCHGSGRRHRRTIGLTASETDCGARPALSVL
jgi:hypothetical protein